MKTFKGSTFRKVKNLFVPLSLVQDFQLSNFKENLKNLVCFLAFGARASPHIRPRLQMPAITLTLNREDFLDECK